MLESNILKSIGMESIDVGFVLIALLVFIVIVIALIVIIVNNNLKIKNLQSRIDRLCMGSDAQSLEEQIAKILEENEYLMTNTEQHKKFIKNIYSRLQNAYQKMAIVRYDGYDMMGGNLSFVIAFLNENDDGFLLNSMHSSSTNYCYLKEVTGGQCNVELGAEEEEALEKAKSVKIPKLVK